MLKVPSRHSSLLNQLIVWLNEVILLVTFLIPYKVNLTALVFSYQFILNLSLFSLECAIFGPKIHCLSKLLPSLLDCEIFEQGIKFMKWFHWWKIQLNVHLNMSHQDLVHKFYPRYSNFYPWVTTYTIILYFWSSNSNYFINYCFPNSKFLICFSFNLSFSWSSNLSV